jgi:protein-L-isoaspartate(D-aspartate) O-methyltransferase
MNFEQARFNMVEQQIRPCEVLDQDVLDILMTVRREQFVPAGYRQLAFADVGIPLGHGAAMLPPTIEARILQALQLRKSDKVLEIGTGSGHMAALLAARADHVYSVERVPELAVTARDNLLRAGFDNVTVEEGDGAQGWLPRAPYDVIVLSGSVEVLPQSLLQQLKPGGRLLAVVGDGPLMEVRFVSRTGQDCFTAATLFETSIAPLVNAPRRGRFVF